jgi:hypothetical protein
MFATYAPVGLGDSTVTATQIPKPVTPWKAAAAGAFGGGLVGVFVGGLFVASAVYKRTAYYRSDVGTAGMAAAACGAVGAAVGASLAVRKLPDSTPST